MGAKESLVDVGDQVLMKNLLPQNKLSTRFLLTPATVVERVGNSVTLKTSEGQVYKRNTSHVRPFVANSDVESKPQPVCQPRCQLTYQNRPTQHAKPRVRNDHNVRNDVLSISMTI